MAKKKILKQNGQDVFPITNDSCVLDNNGVSLNAKIGNLSDLNTDNKANLVSAINDIAALNTTTKQQLVNTLSQYGISGSTNESWSSLINKIAKIADNEGTGLQYAQGSFNLPSQALLSTNTVIEHDMGFTPTFIIVIINQVKYDSCNIYMLPITNIELTKIPTTNDSNSINLQITNITDTSFTINNTGRSAYIYTDTLATYYAIGVGENTTSGGGLDIISATELPVSVKDKQLVVVTDTPMTEAVFHNLQPTIGSGIQEGGVWINTTNNNNVFEYIVSDSPKFSFYILDCYQVISGSYVKKQIYCGVNGTWQHVNPNLYFIQEFINDNPLTEVNGSFANTYNAGTGCQRLHYNTNGGNHSVGGTHKTVKQFNTTGFSKVGIRFSATHASTLILRFYDVTTNSQIGYARGSSSTTIKTLELDIANINDLCYIHVDIDSNNNVSGNYIIDIYDLYLTN